MTASYKHWQHVVDVKTRETVFVAADGVMIGYVFGVPEKPDPENLPAVQLTKTYPKLASELGCDQSLDVIAFELLRRFQNSLGYER